MVDQIQTDVLVIGGGGAACRAALAAHDRHAETVLICKGSFGKSGATAYPVSETAGFNIPDGAADPDDNPDEHLSDILVAGLQMTDENLARILVDGADTARVDLERWGLNFVKDGDKYLSVTTCFSTRPRTHIIKGHGEPIMRALMKEIGKRSIRVIDATMITDLLVQDNKCVGALGVNQTNDRMMVIQAKATILATGGAGRLFKLNLNPPDITGDGYALAFKAGAELVNMEFMQSGVGIVYPMKNMFHGWLWKLYPELMNSSQSHFVYDHLPNGLDYRRIVDEKTHFPFSSRDNSKFIEISIHKELTAGNGTSNDGIFVDFRHIDPDSIGGDGKYSPLKSLLAMTNEWLSERGVDLQREPFEISTFAHAINGGVRIDQNAHSTIPGLFAAGEVAGGPHGADRLGGNMMLTCQVFGKLAGEQAAAFSHLQPETKPDRGMVRRTLAALTAKRERTSKDTAGRLKADLASVMWSNLLVVRSEASIRQAARVIAEIQQKLDQGLAAQTPSEFNQLLELENLLATARIIIAAAESRKESRGSHYREDYPQQSNDFNRPLFVRNGGSEVLVAAGSY